MRLGWRRAALGVAAALGLSGPAAAEDEAKVHVVRPGESLWVIAGNTIGDPTLWPALYRANRDQIKDPMVVYPGQRLTIPVVDPAKRAEVRREASVLIAR